MRLELNIPDNTRSAIKKRLTNLLDRLSARPELVEEIQFNGDAEDSPIRLSAEQVDIIEKAEAEIDAGNCYTTEQVDEHFRKKTSAWNLQRPH